ncbi:MAG: hypothetical protein QS721_03960 [Candidatus Endonucleobacter sp. (ex Gigantidas childressi)]|nr:hypothetical protein [Candidatus Endonucleobacter sp. (ex Gigantidas childressi)]
MLAALAYPDHLLLLGSWDFAYLPPSSNLKSFGYKTFLGMVLINISIVLTSSSVR